MNGTKRIWIYPKDVMRITGKREKYSRNYFKRIREKLQKEEHQFICIEEFCDYTGLKIGQALQFMND